MDGLFGWFDEPLLSSFCVGVSRSPTRFGLLALAPTAADSSTCRSALCLRANRSDPKFLPVDGQEPQNNPKTRLTRKLDGDGSQPKHDNGIRPFQTINGNRASAISETTRT